MLDELKQRVCQANRDLVAEGLVAGTFGNVSGIDRDTGIVAIKPSGVGYDQMTPDQMVLVSLESGDVVEGELRPSSDAPTHLALYRAFGQIGGVIHTHSLHATAWAQACREIPPLGTTHADHFYGPIPCTRPLSAEEIADNYEANTGAVIVERFAEIPPLQMPAVLVVSHGPFAWGETVATAVRNAVALEIVARMAAETVRISPDVAGIDRALLDKHFLRKHGPGSYYGQT
ncbi:MAG: L-ribulose-5-phosphate 4-epimerase AraD [Planctomycetota bacterium]|jgi:L-ribulose-5-phosphate 4-epimerase